MLVGTFKTKDDKGAWLARPIFTFNNIDYNPRWWANTQHMDWDVINTQCDKGYRGLPFTILLASKASWERCPAEWKSIILPKAMLMYADFDEPMGHKPDWSSGFEYGYFHEFEAGKVCYARNDDKLGWWMAVISNIPDNPGTPDVPETPPIGNYEIIIPEIKIIIRKIE